MAEVKELVNKALEDGTKEVEESVSVSVGVSHRSRNLNYFVAVPSGAACYQSPIQLKYPPSVTDQLHAASVAQMVRNGQGAVAEDSTDNFDFVDGKDDGSLEGHSLYETEWADPAEQFESMSRIVRGASRAAPQSVEEAPKIDSKPAVDDKSSPAPETPVPEASDK